MKLWKRNAVVAAIVLFVCAAVYLNWSYSQEGVAADGDADLSSRKTLGEAALVSSEIEEVSEAEEILETAGDEEIEDVTSSSSAYFSNARLTRQQARDNAISILQDTMDDAEAEETVRSQAAESITTMASATVAEAQIENLVTAKGYDDCVAFIGEDSVSVVVAAQEGGLTDADVARIADIVMGETSFTAGQIRVIEAD
jgi:stage III sporulation protein AH